MTCPTWSGCAGGCTATPSDHPPPSSPTTASACSAAIPGPTTPCRPWCTRTSTARWPASSACCPAAGATVPLAPATLAAAADEMLRPFALRPDYSDGSLSWLLDQAAEKHQFGELVGGLVRQSEGDVAGWFLHYIEPGHTSHVLQL